MSEAVWPVEMIGESRPEVSDGFGADKRGGRGHFGADIMFRRAARGESRPPELAPWYMMPSQRGRAIAMRSGTVLRAGRSSTGGYVELAHGSVWGLERMSTIYRHLSTVAVGEGDRVVAGTFLGFVGADPRQGDRGLNHLHFEVWDRSRPHSGARMDIDYGLDPRPYLARCDYQRDGGSGIERGLGDDRSAVAASPASGCAGDVGGILASAAHVVIV